MKNTRPIKVVHVASGDLWAGAEAQLLTLVKALKENIKIDVHVILMNHGVLSRRLTLEGIPVTVFDESKLNAFTILKLLIKRLSRIEPDVIHTHRQKENILGSIAAMCINKCKSVRTVHGAPEHKPSISKPHKYLLSHLDVWAGQHLQYKIIAVSEELKTKLKKTFPELKLCTIENGIDCDELKPFIKPTIMRELEIIKVGIVGRLVPIKRVDIFIRMVKQLRDEYPHIVAQFFIYGDGPLCSKLNELASELDVKDIVYFKGHCMNIHSNIASLDVLLITSDHEGVPMTLLEAMALGTAVVAHSVGGITNVCQGGKCAWLVKNNTVNEFSKRFVECIKDIVARNNKVDLAKMRIRQNYTSVINAEKYVSLYESLR